MEYYRKCDICKKIYCYNDGDISDNKFNKAMVAVGALGTITSVFSGNKLDGYLLDSKTDRIANKIVDFERCPYCKSTRTTLISSDQLNDLDDSNINANVNVRKVDINSNATSDSLLKRVQMYLEEEAWEDVDIYIEQILDIEPECAMAYVYKLMAELRISDIDKIAQHNENLSNYRSYQRALQFSDDEMKIRLLQYNEVCILNEKQKLYSEAIECFNVISDEAGCEEAIKRFEELGDYKESKNYLHKVKECLQKIKDIKYEEIISKIDAEDDLEKLKSLLERLETYKGYREADEYIEIIQAKIAHPPLLRKSTKQLIIVLIVIAILLWMGLKGII